MVGSSSHDGTAICQRYNAVMNSNLNVVSYCDVITQMDGLFFLCPQVHGRYYVYWVQYWPHSRRLRRGNYVPTRQAQSFSQEKEGFH